MRRVTEFIILEILLPFQNQFKMNMNGLERFSL